MVNDTEKINKLSKEGDKLKAEIMKLKSDTKFKEDQLNALTQNEAEKSKTVQEIRKEDDLLPLFPRGGVFFTPPNRYR